MLASYFVNLWGKKINCVDLGVLQTEEGQDIGVWFTKLLEILKGKGSSKGLLFVGHKGKRMSGAEIDLLFPAL